MTNRVPNGSKSSLARGRRVVVDDYRWLRLLAGENESNNPTDKGKAKKQVEDDNSRGVRAVSLYGHDGGKEIHS